MRYLLIAGFLSLGAARGASIINFTNAGIYGAATGQTSFSLFDQGINLTLDTTGTLFGGTLNQSSSGIGVDGAIFHDPLQIELTEEFNITINPSITLDDILITQTGLFQSGEYSINGGPFIPFSGLFIALIPVNMPDVTSIQFREQALLSNYSVAGFSFDVVPEPSTLVLAGIGLAALGVARFKRRQASTPPKLS